MKLKNIKLMNFGPFKNEISVDFTKFGKVICLNGKNGTGKSSFLDAVLFSLFDRCRGINAKGEGLNDLIHNKENKLFCELTVDVNDTLLRIQRGREIDKSELSFKVGNQIFEGKKTDLQNLLNKYIGINYNTFCSSVFLMQNQDNFFLQQDKKERKKTVANLLGLEIYEELELYCKEKNKTLSNEILFLKNEIEKNKLLDLDKLNLEKDFYEKNINELKSSIEILETEINKNNLVLNNYKNLQETNNKIVENNNKISKTISNITNTKEEKIKKILEIKKLLDKKNEYTETLETIKNNILKITEETNEYYKNLNHKILVLEQNGEEIKKINNLISYLYKAESGICPLCESELNKEKIENLIKNKNSELDKLKNSITPLSKEINDCRKKLEEFNNILKKNNTEKDNIFTIVSSFKSKEENIKLYEEEINKIELDIQELIKNIQQEVVLDIDLNKFVSANITLVEKNKKLKEQLNNYILNFGSLLEKIKLEQEKVKNNEILSLKLEEKIKYQNLLLKCIDFFKNAPNFIIQNVIPQIENDANEILNFLSSGSLKMQFSVFNETKSGVEKEDFDIKIFHNGIERNYGLLGAGQCFRPNLALRLAFANYISRNSGTKIDFLVLDEGSGTLDEEGRTLFIETINKLSLLYDKILVVSHFPEIKESFKDSLFFYSKNGISFVEQTSENIIIKRDNERNIDIK